ncbi:MAG: bifunctional serine/threonine-protein kinase/ABC transporter substrate-binding protein [Byssovorax sp.]
MKTQKLDPPADTGSPDSDATLLSVDAAKASGRGGVAEGAVLREKYRLVSLLGSGGMGEVFRGEHLTLGVPIAVKVLRKRVAENPEGMRRFRREAHAVSKLHHPNVVRVLDFDEDPAHGVAFLVMELLEGASLGDWLDGLDRPPPLARVEPIMSAVFAALEAAHHLGIVHRDLKSENVFLARQSDGSEIAKLVDFGLAHVDDVRDAGPTLTKAEIIAGTPQYMSPEQCKSLAVGPSTDLYAAGCVLTDLLQLRPPFSGKSAIEIISKQLFIPPPPLDRPEGAEPVPALLERLRLDLLAKSPEQRPKDAAVARARLIEAMSPEASALRMPARKSEEPLGGRAERLPTWGSPRADSAAPTTAPPTIPTPAPAAAPRSIDLIRLSTDERGVSALCVTGLAAQGISVREIAADDLDTLGVPSVAGAAALLVIDAGEAIEDAVGALEDLRAAPSPPRVLVAGADVSSEQMNELIAAGAADVALYPVSPDALARKIDRALRRKR